MTEHDPSRLSRLERNILETLYRVGEAGASDVVEAMSQDASEDSVRVTLGKLKKRGVVLSRADGNRHIYRPAVPRERARRSAARHLIETYFASSSAKAIQTLLDVSGDGPTDEELGELRAWIDRERGGDE